MELHDKAVAAAMNAALAVSESETWFLGKQEGQQPSNKARKAWIVERVAWLRFSRENRHAPPEALWIRGGALGFHNGKTAFATLPALTQLAFSTFHRVFNDVSDALDAAQADAAASLEAERRAAEAAARPKRAPTEDDLEGTPLERFPDPLAPSEFAARPKPTEAGFQHRNGAQAAKAGAGDGAA